MSGFYRTFCNKKWNDGVISIKIQLWLDVLGFEKMSEPYSILK